MIKTNCSWNDDISEILVIQEQMETEKHNGEEDDPRNAETLEHEASHADERPTRLESEGRSTNRTRHPTAEQTVHRVRHMPGKEDSDEVRLTCSSLQN